MDVRVGLWRKLSVEELILLNCDVGKDSWESLGLQGDPTSPSKRRSALSVHWKDWCWSWNSNTWATSCKELTHWKRSWCWERLKAGGEGDNRGWDCWMASPTQWRWVWVNSGGWWWTGTPGMLQSMGSQESDTTERLNWTELICTLTIPASNFDACSVPRPLTCSSCPSCLTWLFLRSVWDRAQIFLFSGNLYSIPQMKLNSPFPTASDHFPSASVKLLFICSNSTCVHDVESGTMW